MKFPKDNPIRSEAYRRLIASLPCTRCGIEGRSQAAHPPPLGKGIKQDDRLCIPLCGYDSWRGLPGCHWMADNYIQRNHEETVAWFDEASKELRARIKTSGMWPKGLPEL